MKILSIALAGALLATASDAQCIVVSNVFAGQAKDPQQKKVAELSVYFYLGRVGSQMATAQLKTLLDAQAKTLTQQNAGPIMNKCAAAIQGKVDMLKAMAAAAKPAAAKPAQPQGR